MLGTFVVGLGRAGAAPHLPVLRRLRHDHPDRFAGNPIVVLDPHRTVTGPDVERVASARQAAARAEPDATVVHLCTPPTERLGPLRELTDAGFRRFVVDKPLADSPERVRAIAQLARRTRSRVVPVAPWRHSELTRRLGDLVRGGRFGDLLELSFTQDKPRFSRTLLGDPHPTAFDVEVPHALDAAVTLAGSGRVTSAGLTDMRVDGTTFPGMGGAFLRMWHQRGTLTTISSNLTAGRRERRVALTFADARVTGHFAVSDADEYAQLDLPGEPTEVFRDDSLAAFLLCAYRDLAAPGGWLGTTGFDLGAEVVDLIDQAKGGAGLVGAAR